MRPYNAFQEISKHYISFLIFESLAQYDDLVLKSCYEEPCFKLKLSIFDFIWRSALPSQPWSWGKPEEPGEAQDGLSRSPLPISILDCPMDFHLAPVILESRGLSPFKE